MMGRPALPIRHGTYGGWMAHRRRGDVITKDDTCGCYQAMLDHSAEYRESQAQFKRTKRRKPHADIKALATRRANARLAKMHPKDWQALYDQEYQIRMLERGRDVDTP